MPEEIKSSGAPAAPESTEVSSNPSGPVITTVHTSNEVLDANGQTLSSTGSALGNIFEKIASGETADAAIKQASAPVSASQGKPLFEEKKEEIAPTKQEEIVIEKKEEPEAIAKPTEDIPSDKKDDDVSDDELRILPHDKPKTAKRIEKLLKKLSETESKYANTEKEARERAEKLQQLEDELNKTKSADPFARAEVKQRLDELAMYKRRYALENDPEVKKRFDDRVVGAESDIQNLLAENAAPQALIDMIKAEGGWLPFADSRKNIKLSDGKEMTAAELSEVIRSQLSLSDRRRLETMELQQTQIERDKKTYFAEEEKSASDWFAKQELSQKEQALKAQQETERASKYLGDWKEKFTKENDWIRHKEISASLSAEEKANVEDHNNYVKQLNSVLNKYMSANDMDSILEVLTDAMRYHQERRNTSLVLSEKQRLEAALKSKQEELDRFKRSSSATPRSGSLTSSSRQSPEVTTKAPPTLEDAFSRLAEGKSLSE